MSSSREEILANFQGCTGIENVGEAIMWLENSDWDLLAAIKKALPQETQDQNDILMFSGEKASSKTPLRNGVPISVSSDFLGGDPSTSNSKMRMIKIYVHYAGTKLELEIPENMTVGCLKTYIYSETGIPMCQQLLEGWPSIPTSDEIVLSSLMLPSEFELYLYQKDSSRSAGDATPMETESSNLVHDLKIYDEVHNKEYNVKVPGNRTFAQVKVDAYMLTDIPVQSQIWCGWPEGVTDNTLMSQIDMDIPFHCLTIQSSGDEGFPSPPHPPPSPIFIDLVDSDSSPEDFEDASETFAVEEDMFNDDVTSRRPTPLIPDNVEDETAGTVHFIDSFTLRYGPSVPSFYPGPLEEAIKEACLRPAKERRMLAIYLHHDGSVLTNVFCTELLGFETVLETFANYFVVWGWDITDPGNKHLLLSSLMRNLGGPVADTVQNISTDQLPALLILSRSRSNTELLNVIYGNIGINELLTMLIHAVDVFSDMQETEMKEEEVRAAREKIKSEQDKAYQQSLQIDRAKDEARKQQMLLQCQEEERVKREQEEEENKREAERIAVESQLPAEPQNDDSGKSQIITFRFRPPAGETFERRFLSTTQLKVVFDFLLVKGFRIDEYKAISPWPKRDLTTLKADSTLGDLGLCSQETVILEER